MYDTLILQYAVIEINVVLGLFNYFIIVANVFSCIVAQQNLDTQSGRSLKVVALFSATNFSSYIIELLQLHDTIQSKCNNACIHYNIAKQNHLII